MANVAYRKLSDNSYLQQVGNAGGPFMMKVQANAQDGLFYGYVTTDGINWVLTPGGFATVSAAQTILDAYVVQLNAGTA
jgi:hypothetical protein